jgi:Ni,Fe-hydrogenase III large subunit
VSRDFDFSTIRDKIYIPEMIADNSIKTDAPFCYRKLDDCLALIEDLIQVEERFEPIAYLGQI